MSNVGVSNSVAWCFFGKDEVVNSDSQRCILDGLFENEEKSEIGARLSDGETLLT